MAYSYFKVNEQGNREFCPIDDKDAKVTGRYILNVPKWFDENPEERKRLGWIKHITYNDKEIKEKWPHTQSQYLLRIEKMVDEYTIEDDYKVMDKSEEQMLFEEMLEVAQNSWEINGGFTFTM